MDKFLLKHTTKEAKVEMTKAMGLPDTKSRKMLNVINYATHQKPTKKYALGVTKPC